MININREKEQKVKELLKNQKIDQKNAKKTDMSFFDPTLEQTKKKRDKVKMNAFHFVEQGTYDKKIESLTIRQTAKQLGLDLNNTQLTVRFY